MKDLTSTVFILGCTMIIIQLGIVLILANIAVSLQSGKR